MCIAIALLALAAAVAAGCRPDAPPLPRAALYVNEAHGFMVAYPDTFALRESGAHAAAIGRQVEGAFEPAVVVTVEMGDADTLPGFIRQSALLACAVDEGESSRRCTEILEAVPFESMTGVEGERFQLRQLATNPATGEVLVSGERGPLFAFPLPDSPAGERFAVLYIGPPAGLEAERTDAELVTLMATSLRMTSAWVMR